MHSESNSSTVVTVSRIAIALAVGLGLFAISRYNYLLFHSLAEIFSIVIALGIFMFAWNSRNFQGNHYLVFVGIAYLFVGGIDLLHALSYKGMGVFAESGAQRPTQLWIVARYVEALSLLAAPIFIKRRMHAAVVFGIYSFTVVALLASVFVWKIFPVCFVEGTGLTNFKKASEFIICGILVLAAVFLFRRRHEVDDRFFVLTMWSIGITILAELSFTLYADVYGLSNLVGHYLKIVSFYLLYIAIIHSGLQKPYKHLFGNLARSEKRFRSLFDEMLGGFAHHEIICDEDGKPVDYRFLSVNPAFEKLTSLKARDLVGRTVLEVMPRTEAHWIERYGRVALTGEPAHFESYSSVLDRHYYVAAFCPADGEFACIFQDVTTQKKSEKEREELIEELRDAVEQVKTLRGMIPICSYCKQIRDDRGAWSLLEEYVSRYSDAQFTHGICPSCYEKHIGRLDDEDEEH